MILYKDFARSQTIQFFFLVLAGGGLDIIDQLVKQEEISWRSVAIAIVAIIGIALRLKTTKPIKPLMKE